MNGDHELGIDLQLEHEQYNEKCGVFGVYVRAPLLFSPPCVVFVRRSRYLILPQNVEQAADTTYYGMVGLQHRGQEGAGLVSVAHNKAGVACDFKLHRGHGLLWHGHVVREQEAQHRRIAVAEYRVQAGG